MISLLSIGITFIATESLNLLNINYLKGKLETAFCKLFDILMVMEKHSTQLLFVYGTLLLPENKYGQFLLQNSTLFSSGRFPGELFDLGAYPGAVHNYDIKEFVFGKVFKMNDAQQVLATLDDYEGLGEPNCEYKRMAIEVSTDQGPCLCYSYIYIHPTQDKIKIAGGSYLSYLKGSG